MSHGRTHHDTHHQSVLQYPQSLVHVRFRFIASSTRQRVNPDMAVCYALKKRHMPVLQANTL
jgi:hypothetical protein